MLPWNEKPLDNEIETWRIGISERLTESWNEKPLDNEIETQLSGVVSAIEFNPEMKSHSITRLKHVSLCIVNAGAQAWNEKPLDNEIETCGSTG